jgi:hypothetical protein
MKTDIGAWLLVLSSCLTSSREEIFIELNIRIEAAIVLLLPCFFFLSLHPGEKFSTGRFYSAANKLGRDISIPSTLYYEEINLVPNTINLNTDGAL